MIKAKHIRNILSNNKQIVNNFSYVTLLEVFILLAPLITYPYLIRVLGIENYGVVITAQVLASYASKIIDFGSNGVCAKHVSVNRNDKLKLSEIVSSVLSIRFILWLFCLIIYVVIVLLVPIYRTYITLFLLSYLLTINDVLFPQYFFQGIERMKYISIINITVKLLFILLIFLLVKDESDMNFVPLLYAVGYAMAGIISMYIIYAKIGLKLYVPHLNVMIFYAKDSLPIFATDMICTIKDKLSYFIIGSYCGMSDVVIYDLGLKINGLLVRPLQIISTVLFPRFAKSRNTNILTKVALVVILLTILIVILTNIFMPCLVKIFIDDPIDLMPLRLFSLAPLFLSVSSFLGFNFFVAFGYNKYLLYSIIITTIVYILTLLLMLVTNNLGSIYSFIILSLVAYLAELLYRLFTAYRLIRKERKSIINLNYK